MTQGKQPIVWVVIADGEHARVVVPTATPHHFKTLLLYDSVDAHNTNAFGF